MVDMYTYIHAYYNGGYIYTYIRAYYKWWIYIRTYMRIIMVDIYTDIHAYYNGGYIYVHTCVLSVLLLLLFLFVTRRSSLVARRSACASASASASASYYPPSYRLPMQALAAAHARCHDHADTAVFIRVGAGSRVVVWVVVILVVIVIELCASLPGGSARGRVDRLLSIAAGSTRGGSINGLHVGGTGCCQRLTLRSKARGAKPYVPPVRHGHRISFGQGKIGAERKATCEPVKCGGGRCGRSCFFLVRQGRL